MVTTGFRNIYVAFLSTLPARGATEQSLIDKDKLVISIHAPREGSDMVLMVDRLKRGDFYPRSPRGERPASTTEPEEAQ